MDVQTVQNWRVAAYQYVNRTCANARVQPKLIERIQADDEKGFLALVAEKALGASPSGSLPG